MAAFRKRPLRVEAMRVGQIIELGAKDDPSVPDWLAQAFRDDPETDEGYGAQSRLIAHESHIEVRTKQGQWIEAEWDEWIVCAAPDDLWPVDPDVFAASYEPSEQKEREES